MSHKRTDSVASVASVASYDSLKPEIANIEIEALVTRAEELIAEFQSSPLHIFEHGPRNKPKSLELDKVMTAMLATAEECGGEEGKRYLASALVACERSDQAASKHEVLRDLEITWVTHLLFIFKTSHGHGNQRNHTPNAHATPTHTETSGMVEQGVGNRSGTFKENLLERDGYQCVVTGTYDMEHPRAAELNVVQVEMIGAHILRRAVADFDEDKESDSYRSALTTLDILRNFARLPDKTLKDLEGHVDHESNGMIPEGNTHSAFDKFRFCFKSTEKEDVYKLKFYGKPPGIIINFRGLDGLDAPVEFRDRSAEFLRPGSRKRAREYELPNPHFLFIHAAICGILHMSGAGNFFDELLKPDNSPDGPVPPVSCWPEYEKWLATMHLRDDLIKLSSISVS